MGILSRLVRALLLSALASLALPAARAEVSEADLKAAFLLNFARYVQFPAEAFPSADAPLVIGVVGSGQVAAALEALAKGERAGSRPIAVQRGASKSCQIVFVGSGAPPGGGPSCLTVGDGEDFLRQGGAIRFFSVVDRKVKFEINPKAIARQRVQLSPPIKRLARVATDGR